MTSERSTEGLHVAEADNQGLRVVSAGNRDRVTAAALPDPAQPATHKTAPVRREQPQRAGAVNALITQPTS